MLHDLELQAKALAPVLKALVSQHIDAAKQEIIGLLTAKHSDLAGNIEQRFNAIPTFDVDAIVKNAAALIEIPTPEKGEDGKSVTIDDIRELIAQAVEGIELPQAEPGAKGEPGKDGDSVPAEAVQAMVEEAVAKAVSAIPKAADGNPGRDALDIEILPVIDAEKSYPRGTYAMHRGGLWKSFQNTVGWTGWECLVNGVHKFHVAQLDANDPRKFYAISELSDCTSIHTDITLPTMQYKQVWKEGVNYQKGDTVTWGGSLWHCEKDTAEKPSEGHECWKLAVKKGRDGKV